MGASDWDDFDREGRTDYSAIYTETQGVSRKSEPIVPSLRAEGFREAVEDFKYLKMLDEAIVQAEETGVDEVLVSTAKQQRVINCKKYENKSDKLKSVAIQKL